MITVLNIKHYDLDVRLGTPLAVQNKICRWQSLKKTARKLPKKALGSQTGHQRNLVVQVVPAGAIRKDESLTQEKFLHILPVSSPQPCSE